MWKFSIQERESFQIEIHSIYWIYFSYFSFRRLHRQVDDIRLWQYLGYLKLFLAATDESQLLLSPRLAMRKFN